MKSSLFASGLLGLAFVGLWFVGGGTQPLSTARADDSPRVAAPLTHENLAVYFVHGPDTVSNAKVMSLQEALERELAVVHETSEVNTLAVENCSSDYDLFIQSGDIVKGGKQDRMAQHDMLVPPRSGLVPLPAHCVEQGRWTGRGNEDSGRFKSSERCAVGQAMKIANYSGQQGEVWKTVQQQQTRAGEAIGTVVQAEASPTSLQLTLESPAIQAKVASYEAALKTAGEARDNIIGVVFVVNGQVTGAEVYGSNALFRKAWPKLLNSAAVEAIAEKTENATASAPSAGEIEYFLARGADPEPPGAIGEFVPERMTAQFNRRGVIINNAEEIVQTEGRLPEVQQTEGRAPDAFRERITTAPVIPPPLRTVTAPNPAGAQAANPTVAAPDSVIMTGSGAAQVALPPPPPANNNGNRLQSNRTGNSSTLMVESRDPTRQNAIIHKSYVKR